LHPPHANVLDRSIQNPGFGFINGIDCSFGNCTQIVDSSSDFAPQPIAKIIVAPIDNGFVVGHSEEGVLELSKSTDSTAAIQ
jgi:hypothetical protein